MMEDKMNPLPEMQEHHFYPEGSSEQFYMSFNSDPSRPEFSENDLNQDVEAQEKESPFRRKTWTKTTNSWV
jgi:hypothetical protein